MPASPLSPLRHASANLAAANACKLLLLLLLLMLLCYYAQQQVEHARQMEHANQEDGPWRVLQSQLQLWPATED